MLANLLIELLYVRGDECPTLKSLPKLYQDHFKAPLPLSCVGAVDVPALMQLHRVKDGINLVNVTVSLSSIVASSCLEDEYCSVSSLNCSLYTGVHSSDGKG